MSGKIDRKPNLSSRTIAIILAALGGICLISIACVAIVGVAGRDFFFFNEVGAVSNVDSGAVIAGSNTRVGDAATEFTLQSVDGETYSLSDYRGRVVFINFWATWCPPCEAEMPVIESVYETYEDQGFAVLAVNTGDPPDAIRAFQQEERLSFPLLMDRDALVTDAYQIRAFPTSVLIDQ